MFFKWHYGKPTIICDRGTRVHTQRLVYKNDIYLDDFLIFHTACDQKKKMVIYDCIWTPKLFLKKSTIKVRIHIWIKIYFTTINIMIDGGRQNIELSPKLPKTCEQYDILTCHQYRAWSKIFLCCDKIQTINMGMFRAVHLSAQKTHLVGPSLLLPHHCSFPITLHPASFHLCLLLELEGGGGGMRMGWGWAVLLWKGEVGPRQKEERIQWERRWGAERWGAERWWRSWSSGEREKQRWWNRELLLSGGGT